MSRRRPRLPTEPVERSATGFHQVVTVELRGQFAADLFTGGVAARRRKAGPGVRLDQVLRYAFTAEMQHVTKNSVLRPGASTVAG